MSVTITLSGNSINYTFPANFDILEWTEPRHIPRQKVIGSDGVQVDTNAISEEPVTIRVAGTLVGTSYANLETLYASMRAAVNATPDPMTLSDGTRSIDVYKQTMTTERVPGSNSKQYRIGITFVGTSGNWS